MYTVEIDRLLPLGIQLPEEMWCHDMFGPKYQKINNTLTHVWSFNGDWWQLQFKFSDPAHATMFRLKWS